MSSRVTWKGGRGEPKIASAIVAGENRPLARVSKEPGEDRYTWLMLPDGTSGKSWALADAQRAVERHVKRFLDSRDEIKRAEPTVQPIEGDVVALENGRARNRLLAEGALAVLMAPSISDIALVDEAISVVRAIAKAADAR